MLITYKKTQEDYAPQPGDECEVYVDKTMLWVLITQIEDDGYIRTIDQEDRRVDFPTKQELFDAIGDV